MTTTTKTDRIASLLTEAEADLAIMQSDLDMWVHGISSRPVVVRYDGGGYLGLHATKGGRMGLRTRKHASRMSVVEADTAVSILASKGIAAQVLSPIVGLEMDIEDTKKTIELLNRIAHG